MTHSITFNPTDRSVATMANQALITPQSGDVFGNDLIRDRFGPPFKLAGYTFDLKIGNAVERRGITASRTRSRRAAALREETTMSGNHTFSRLKPCGRPATRLIAAIVLLLASPAAAQLQGTVTVANYPQYETTLDASQERDVRQLAVAIVGALHTGARISITLNGHADFDAKGRDFETEVSLKRAQNAEARLRVILAEEAAKAGLPAARLQSIDCHAFGLGTLRPVHRNPTPEQRPDNRRVEFVWSVVPQLQLPVPPGTAFQRCLQVLTGASPAGPVRRMTCACQKFLQSPQTQDSYYDFNAARQAIPGSAGMPTLTLEQWEAAMRALVRHMKQDITQASAANADPDYAAALIRLDDLVGANIENFAKQATGGVGMGLFDQVILADIKARMANAKHVYSCYAGYSRRTHDN